MKPFSITALALALAAAFPAAAQDNAQVLQELQALKSRIAELESQLKAQEAGKARVEAEEFFLEDWASDIGNILGPIAASNGVALELDGPEDAEAKFRSDPMRLSQILLNLGHNAVKFSGGGGRMVRVGISLREKHLEIRVRDEGPGIDPARLPSLFGEFEQSEVKGPKHDRGVGLGLAVVARNAALLGGRVSARNLEAGGMEFKGSIPPLPEAVQ